jgi:hypothetical protein
MADASNGRAVFSSSRNTHYAARNAIQDEIAALSQPVDALFWINRLIKALLRLVALRGLYEWQRRTRYRENQVRALLGVSSDGPAALLHPRRRLSFVRQLDLACLDSGNTSVRISSTVRCNGRDRGISRS